MGLTCSRCGRTAPEVAFPGTGLRCLECSRAVVREHYRGNRDYYVAKARRRQIEVVARTRVWLLDHLKSHPCVDCGTSDVRVLEFDHRDGTGKVAAVAVLARAGYPLERVVAEVAKCDVRCANCHRIRTHTQRGWWGSTVEANGTRVEASLGAPGGIRTPKPSDP